MRRLIGVVVLLAGFSAGAVIAQDGPITIKLRKAGPGDTVKETKTESGKTKVVISIMGKDETKDEDTLTKLAFTDEVIEKAAGAAKPTKVKRTYDKAEMTKSGAKVDLGLDGKIVLIEKKDDAYTYTVDGKDVSGEAADMLKKEFATKKSSSEDDFLPNKPVKVGDTWIVDVAKIAPELAEGGMVIDEKASKATGKLVKIYDKAGAKFGVLEIEMDLVVSKLKAAQEIPLKEGSKLMIKITMDGCVDGTSATGGGVMSMKGNLAGEVMGVALKFGLDMKVEGKTEQVKK